MTNRRPQQPSTTLLSISMTTDCSLILVLSIFTTVRNDLCLYLANINDLQMIEDSFSSGLAAQKILTFHDQLRMCFFMLPMFVEHSKLIALVMPPRSHRRTSVRAFRYLGLRCSTKSKDCQLKIHYIPHVSIKRTSPVLTTCLSGHPRRQRGSELRSSIRGRS